MSAKVENLTEDNGVMRFTLNGVDVAYTNGIRRVILSSIPILVFKTSPQTDSKANIMINTTRLNNEIIKQRLSLIPICIDDMSIPYQDFLLEVDVQNMTDSVMYITTGDFRIKRKSSGEYLSETDTKKIFPPFIPATGKGEYYIDFARLRPRISDEIPGEQLKLTCEFTIGSAQEDSAFNITGTCSYGCTPDRETMMTQLDIRKQKWRDEQKSPEEIEYESKNWLLLEGLRYIKRRSFDFVVESLGIYDNTTIILKACDILLEKIYNQKQLLESDKLDIKPSDSTMENSFDIRLENEDYTLGNILNIELYNIFYTDLKLLSYIGFEKLHPHDDYSIIRMAFTDVGSGIAKVNQLLKSVLVSSEKTILSIKGCFDGKKSA
jgi:DNA-directed RNA polymerase subunit L